MNNDQRKKIDALFDRLEETRIDISKIADTEDAALKRMAPGARASVTGQAASAAVEALNQAQNGIEVAIEKLEEAKGRG